MVSADISLLASYGLWAVLPNLLTQSLLSFCYSQKLLSRPTSQHLASLHSTYARTFIVLSYFIYQVYNAVQSLEPNHFQVLSLQLDHTDEESVKSSFRKLAKIYHPDKVGSSVDSESLFIKFRAARDVLSDPVIRFAYERFGPSITSWKNSVTLREYMSQGLTDWAMQHAITSAFYASVMWFNGNLRFNFWRDSCFLMVLTIELHLLTLPYRPTILSILFPNFTPYEITHLLSKLYVSASMATNHLSQCFQTLGQLLSSQGDGQNQNRGPNPVPLDEPSKLKDAELIIEALEKRIERVEKLSLAVKEESRRVLKNEIDEFITSSPSGGSSSEALKEKWASSVSSEIYRQHLSGIPAIQAQMVKEALKNRQEEGEAKAPTSASNAGIETEKGAGAAEEGTNDESSRSSSKDGDGSEKWVEVKEPKEILMGEKKEEELSQARERVGFVDEKDT